MFYIHCEQFGYFLNEQDEQEVNAHTKKKSNKEINFFALSSNNGTCSCGLFPF